MTRAWGFSSRAPARRGDKATSTARPARRTRILARGIGIRLYDEPRLIGTPDRGSSLGAVRVDPASRPDRRPPLRDGIHRVRSAEAKTAARRSSWKGLPMYSK